MKRVARIDAAGLEPPAQPFDALLRRSVCKGFRDDCALRLPLQPVIADGSRRAQTLLSITGLEQSLTLCIVSPYTRITISLQLLAD